MVTIDYKIIIAGILALTLIQMTLIICDHDSTITTSTIVGIIALSIGVIIPVPKIDNIKGTLHFNFMGC